MPSLYRRPLPDPCVPFSSPAGRTLFREALDAGTMEGFFPLVEQFHTQSDPAFCGLSSLVVALNALGVDPGRLWKGPWRWFGEELLDCCTPLETVREVGVTLLQLGCLARCNGADTDVAYADERSVAALREDVLGAARSAGGLVLIGAYSRAALAQTGDGHFSPLGGYHAPSDSVLVLDVARFKYPPHWVPVPLLYEAMQKHDAASSRARGWLKLRPRGTPSSLTYYVSCRGAGWMDFLANLFSDAPARLARAAPESGAAALHVLATACIEAGLTRLVELRDTGAEEHAAAAETMRCALRATRVHRVIEPAIADGRSELVAMFAFAAPPELWRGLSPAAASELSAWLDEARAHPLLAPEIAHITTQIAELRKALAIDW